MYKVVFSKQAAKDAKRLKATGLDTKAKELVKIVAADPFAYPPVFEPLVGSFTGMYSRRINRQHRFVCEVLKEPSECDGEAAEGTVRVLRMWSHYETI